MLAKRGCQMTKVMSRHLHGSEGADALQLTVDAAQQWRQPKRGLHRTDLRRRGGNDVVAGQCQFEATAKANAMDTRDQWDRQQFHIAEELDAVQAAVFVTGIATAQLNALVEYVEIGAGREMSKPAAKDDRPATGFLRFLDLLDDGIDQLRPKQIVGSIDHGQHGNIATLLARNQCILGHHAPPLFGATTRPAFSFRSDYTVTCILQVMSARRIKLNDSRHSKSARLRFADSGRFRGSISENALNASGPIRPLPDLPAAANPAFRRVARSRYRPLQASPCVRFFDLQI